MDDRVPEHRDSHASSSHEPSLVPTRNADLGKHNVKTDLPKDRNCEICQRTKITRAPCRRRNGGAVPRAENVGGLITADHKVLSENCESRNNHGHAVVVQDLATQWIQSYPCKTKTSQETQRSLQSGGKSTLRKHSIYTHFPKSRDCDVCLRTKMTRAPCRRRSCEALPRAEKFGDLVEADHKVLNEECEPLVRCRSARSCHSMDRKEDGVRSGSITGGGGLARVPDLRVCKHP